MQVLLIHNPAAGDEELPTAELVTLLAQAGHRAAYQSAHLDDLEAALGGPHELIAIAGGDGAVSRGLKRCAGQAAPVAILPLGTANNIARGLGHMGAPGELIARWRADAGHRPFHFGFAEGEWGASRFAESFGIGVLADTIAAGAQERDEKFASPQHKLASLRRRLRKALSRSAPLPVDLEVDGEPRELKTAWLEVSRVGLVGPNVPVIDDLDPFEARLRIAWLPPEAHADCATQLNEADLRGGLFHSLVGERIRLAWSDCEAHIDGVLPPRSSEGGQRRSVELSLHATPVRVLKLD